MSFEMPNGPINLADGTGPYQNQPNNVSKGFAVTALVLGIVAIALFWTGGFAILIGIVGLVFGIIALVKKQSKGFALTGTILSDLAIIGGIIMTIIAAMIISQAATDVQKGFDEYNSSYAASKSAAENAEYKLSITASGAKGSTVTVSIGQNQKEYQVDGDGKFLSEVDAKYGDIVSILTSSPIGADSNKTTCELSVNGKSVSTSDVNGIATCSTTVGY